MAQPSFVPITEADLVRPSMPQPVPTHVKGRPSEVHSPITPSGDGIGSPGPDQGYALTLIHGIHDRVVLREDEEFHDVEVGIALLAGRRASLFGRAPSIYDVEVALGLFGYLAKAPEDLVTYRKAAFQAIGHSYVAQRQLVDSVPESSLRLSPDEAASGSSRWRQLLNA